MNYIHKFILLPIMVVALMLIVTSANAEDYNYVELSQGIKIKNAPWGSSNWNGSCPTAIAVGRHWNYSKTIYFRAQLMHISNICRGKPFSNTPSETWLDQFNVTIGIKF